ncbi:MAG: hypothetical protein M1372_00095 [Patescibacteria group bacterium]|nr:hypothetical protein [Patescibacteria group bacterium]
MDISSPYQKEQIGLINQIEQQVISRSFRLSAVSPVNDFGKDTRICLTSVHIPHEQLINKIESFLIEPLRKVTPDYFFYPPDSLHMSIKNVRVINDPPHFVNEDISKATQVFESVIPRHKRFNVYFYRLLLFPNNLALVGTTDPELDNIILDLDRELKKAGVPDDKVYISSQRFFSNTTLARFNNAPTREFLKRVEELSKSISFEPYTVDSVTLLTCNAVFLDRNIIKTWELK